MVTVAIIEDDEDIRESLAAIINHHRGVRCIATYADCESGISGILAQPPDVILMDIGLPGMPGIEGIKILKQELPELDIIVLTIHAHSKVVFDALCAGACGYLLKDTKPARLIAAIREAKQGGAPMSMNIARKVVESFQAEEPPPFTPREFDVLNQLCRGKSYKMIALSLDISEETVHVHLKNIYKKLQVNSKSAAVAKAFQRNLVNM